MSSRLSVEGDEKELAREAIKLATESKLSGTPMTSVKTPVGEKKIPAYFPIPKFDYPEHYIQTQKIMKIIGYGVRSNGFFVLHGFDSKDLPQQEFLPPEPEEESKKPEKPMEEWTAKKIAVWAVEQYGDKKNAILKLEEQNEEHEKFHPKKLKRAVRRLKREQREDEGE